MKRKTKAFLTAAVCLLLASLAVHASTIIEYGYDELNRLRIVRFEDGTAMLYTYDDVGNRLSRTVEPNSAPYAPSDPSFPDGAEDVSTSPEIYWTGGDPHDDAVTYDVFLDTNAQPTTLLFSGQSTPVIHPQGLSCFTTYYWSVRATDRFGAVTQGPVWHFTTGRGDPAKNLRTGAMYSTLQAAYNVASEGDTILSQDIQLTGNFSADRDISITIDGGYDCNFSSNSNKTTISGYITINNGIVNLENYIIAY